MSEFHDSPGDSGRANPDISNRELFISQCTGKQVIDLLLGKSALKTMDAHAQFLAHQEAVHCEAQRIASLSAWKLLRSRSQRGGMRLHRSLQLSMVMRSARELIISYAHVAEPKPVPAQVAVARESRKRRSCGTRLPELVPSKRACLWQETPEPQPQGGAFPGLAEVLQRLLGSVPPPLPGGCRILGASNIPGVNTRPVEAF